MRAAFGPFVSSLVDSVALVRAAHDQFAVFFPSDSNASRRYVFDSSSLTLTREQNVGDTSEVWTSLVALRFTRAAPSTVVQHALTVIDGLRDRVTEEQARVEAAEAVADGLRLQLAEAAESMASCDGQMAAKDLALANLRDNYAAAEKERAEAQDLVSTLDQLVETTKRQAEQRAERQRAETAEAREEGRRARAALEEALAGRDKQIADLGTAVSDLRARLDSAGDVERELRTDGQREREAASEREARALETAAHHRGEAAELRGEVGRLEAELAASQDRVAKLESGATDAETRAREQRGVEDQLIAVRSELDMVRSEKERLAGEVAAKDTRIAELDQRWHDVGDKLRVYMAEWHTTLEAKDARVDAAQTEAARLAQRVAELEEELGALKSYTHTSSVGANRVREASAKIDMGRFLELDLDG